MVAHMVALAKLHGLRPALVGVACPLVLKFLLGFRVFRDEALFQSRFFLFRLGQIAFNRETPLSNVARMERALRLIYRTISVSDPSSQEEAQIEQDTFHDLSMLSL